MIDQQRKKGPVLLMDAGNGLFKAPGQASPADKERAAFILATLGKLETQAMAVGARDLNLGPQWLKEQAQKAKVPLLSVNLIGADGKPLFAASRIVEVGGKKVGIIGASPATVSQEGAKGVAPLGPISGEAKRLRPKTDLIVVLAAMPYSDALQLSTQVGSAVDFILQSHEGRGANVAQKGEGHFLLSTGERGRQVGRLVLELDGKGPFVDAGELARDRQTLKALEGQLAQVKQRLAAAKDDQTKQALQETARQFDHRRKEVASRVAAGGKAGGRGMALDWISLTSEIEGDPVIAAGVQKIEPAGAAH